MTEFEGGKELVNIPVTSQLRVITGIIQLDSMIFALSAVIETC